MGKGTVTNPLQANCFEGGKLEEAGDDVVEVRTGVTLSTLSTPVPSDSVACQDSTHQKSGYCDGITIRIKCKNNPHLLQFVSREIIGSDKKLIESDVKTTAGKVYPATLDPKFPSWTTDSIGESPYYESRGVHRTESDSLTTFDQPGLEGIRAGEARRATFMAYAFCAGNVVREIIWVREQTFGSAPFYTVKMSKKSMLSAEALRALKKDGYKL